MKKLWLSVLLVALLLLTVSPPAIMAKSDGPGKVNATDVQIIKKVTLKGPAAKGGKPAPTAATGDLGATCTGTKYAIVIGINDYPSSDLSYAVADANEMNSVLLNTYEFNEVILLTDTAATRIAIYDAINAVKGQAVAGDEVVFSSADTALRVKRMTAIEITWTRQSSSRKKASLLLSGMERWCSCSAVLEQTVSSSSSIAVSPAGCPC